MSVLKLSELTKRFGRKQALSGITCEFKTGINALLGPNGAGKTTIMNCVTGILPLSGGSVTLDGRNVFSMGEEYRKRISYQFQTPPFYPSYTAYDFLRFSALLKGLESNDTDNEISRVLELVDLSDNGSDRIRTFSGGMKQRLAIAQTILGSPEILIFDEPTAGLDPFEREQFKRIMVKLKKQSIIIISTHIVSDIDTICDSLVILNKGEVIANASPEELYDRIRGRIWSVPRSDIDRISIDRIYYEDTLAKTVSVQKPTENAVPSEPTLNDLYFCGQIDSSVFKTEAG